MEVGLLEVEGEDLIGLVIETGCAYASPISFPQRVEIGLRVARTGNSSVTYHLGVFVEGAEAASAQGHFTHVYVDRTDRRPAKLDERWRSLRTRVEERRWPVVRARCRSAPASQRYANKRGNVRG